MHHLTMGYVLRNVSLGSFVILHTQGALTQSIAYSHLGYMEPITPRLQGCIACYCTNQHEIKSRTSENDTIKRGGKRDG